MPSKNNFQKELRIDISQKIDHVLSDLKALLSEKEFADRVKKAAKLLTDGVKAKAAPKETVTVKKKPAKKNAAVKAEEAVAIPVESVDIKTPAKKAAAKKAKAKKK